MPYLALNTGEHVLWEPTTALVCSGCRHPLDHPGGPREALRWTNLMFDLVNPKDTSLVLGDYWYLHKQCSHLGDVLRQHGVDVHWGWYGMTAVLGLESSGWKRYVGDTPKFLKKLMPPGCYDALYANWLPAFRPSRSQVRFPVKPTPKRVIPLRHTPGQVYLIEALGTGLIKIGHGNNATVRLKALSTGTPFPLRLLRVISSTDAQRLEHILHTRYAAFRRHNEWFALPSELLAALLTEKFA